MNREKGFGIVPIVIIVTACMLAALLVWRLWPAQTAVNLTAGDVADNATDPNAIWVFKNAEWTPESLPPRCANPFIVKSPADVSAVSSVLYPGQVRGGNYKPHGGLRFDGKKNEDITVRAPFDAKIINAARYIEQGEVQYMFTFVHPCGIAYRVDHLLTLSSSLQKVADTLPPAKVDDSRTTPLTDPIDVKSGDVLATAVGFKKSGNVAFDFGLYDLRMQNVTSRDAGWAAKHANDKEYAWNAVCWLDWLESGDKAKLKALPAGDSVAGKSSDYCK